MQGDIYEALAAQRNGHGHVWAECQFGNWFHITESYPTMTGGLYVKSLFNGWFLATQWEVRA